MTEETPGQRPSTTEQILDLLLDALAERQRKRGAGIPPSSPLLTSPKAEGKRETTPSPLLSPVGERETEPSSPLLTSPKAEGEREASPSPQPSPSRERGLPPARPTGSLRTSPLVPKPPLEPGEEGWKPPARLPSIEMGRFLGRLAIVVAALVVLINIPVRSHGVSLARILPDTASLIIRDGLVLKGPGSEIYILEDNKLRWISSMDAFEHLGLTWNDVHVVDDAFLKQFEMGHPVSVILKCNSSPNIYALEDGKKRWIKDIETFTAEGYVWEDVQFVQCTYLHNLPNGLPIPEDAGTPPQP